MNEFFKYPTEKTSQGTHRFFSSSSADHEDSEGITFKINESGNPKSMYKVWLLFYLSHVFFSLAMINSI